MSELYDWSTYPRIFVKRVGSLGFWSAQAVVRTNRASTSISVVTLGRTRAAKALNRRAERWIGRIMNGTVVEETETHG